MKLEFSEWKTYSNIKFHKTSSSEAELFHVDRWTERQA